jgi:hypothetical protein
MLPRPYPDGHARSLPNRLLVTGGWGSSSPRQLSSGRAPESAPSADSGREWARCGVSSCRDNWPALRASTAAPPRHQEPGLRPGRRRVSSLRCWPRRSLGIQPKDLLIALLQRGRVGVRQGAPGRLSCPSGTRLAVRCEHEGAERDQADHGDPDMNGQASRAVPNGVQGDGDSVGE